MAAASPVQGLQEEAKCSICLEYYKDPVITKCGHNFCRACITRCSEGAGAALSCPQCREPCPRRCLRPNRQLQSIVEFVKQLSVQWKRLPGEGLCEKHVQRLNLFCEEDLKLICVNCRESMEHKTHNVRPLEEAAQEYKEKLEAERTKIVAEFEKLQQLLKEQEQTLLERLEEMEKKLTTVENAERAKLSAEISSLEDLITEIEKKSEQPAGELLKEFRGTLSRCELVPLQTLEGIRKKYKEHVTLDADTAHAHLALSEAGRRVTNTRSDQTPPAHPKRFTGRPSVLGRGGATAGRHYWELELLREGGGWDLGVAQESVSRGRRTLSPEGGVWAVEGYKNQYLALTAPPTPLTPALPLRKLGVYLDYEGGRVSVYNASTMEELYTFTGAPFRGTVCPYFTLYLGTDLRLL